MKIRILSIVLIASWAPSFLLGQLPSHWEENCLTHNAFENSYASWSPDGEWIVFESNRDGDWEIYLMDRNGQNVKRLTHAPGEDRRPGWHPDGNTILFESKRNGDTELFTLNVKNQRVKRVGGDTSGRGELMFASFSPDGKRIAVSVKETEEKSNIVILSKRGKPLMTVVDNGNRNYYPRWSRDGKELLYFSRKDTGNTDDEIYRVDWQTSVEWRLTNEPGHNFCPAWSGDNSQIVYATSLEGTRPEIFIMDKDGNNKIRITHNADGETLLNWHPEEQKILLSAFRNGSYQVCELTLMHNQDTPFKR